MTFLDDCGQTVPEQRMCECQVSDPTAGTPPRLACSRQPDTSNGQSLTGPRVGLVHYPWEQPVERSPATVPERLNRASPQGPGTSDRV